MDCPTEVWMDLGKKGRVCLRHLPTAHMKLMDKAGGTSESSALASKLCIHVHLSAARNNNSNNSNCADF